MIRRRTVKQASYAGGCVVFLALGITGIWLLVRSPRQATVPPPTPTATYQAIVVEQVVSVRHERVVDVVVRLRNNNAHVGVAALPLTVVVEDGNAQELSRQDTTTYVMPGSLQYVTLFNLSVSAGEYQVRVELPANTAFQELPSGIRAPLLTAFPRGPLETKIAGGAASQQQKGIASNGNNSYGMQRVEVVALAFDKQKNVIGIGKTFVGELKVGEQREFTVGWPAPVPAVADIILSPSANVFELDNIIEVVGDPNTLR